MPRFLSVSDLRGAVRLATTAATGATDVVEAMHTVITRPTGTSRRKGGIPGLVYRTVRRTMRRVGRGVDGALALADRGTPGEAPAREAVVAALNGAFGDHLADEGNPLAIEMHLRHAGAPLDMSPVELAIPDARPTILLQVHGICMHEGQWRRDGHDPGAEWAEAIGATRLAVRYNSGRHISQTGRDLARQLDALLDAWPVPVERLVVVGHSMGGLVARSAFAILEEDGVALPADTTLVCLGSPHHGAPLERLGNLVDTALRASRYSGPLVAVSNARSPGVTDLRYGSVHDADWADRDRFERAEDDRRHVPLPTGVTCYLVAATLGTGTGGVRDFTIGDGLVPLGSALGVHPDPARTLDVPPDHRWTLPRASHLDLLWALEVTEQVREWLVRDGA